MSIFERVGSPYWQIQGKHCNVRYRESTKFRARTATGAIDKAERARAEDRERIVRAEIANREKLGLAPPMTLGEAVRKYYDDYLEPVAKPKAAKHYLYLLTAIANQLGEHTKLTDLKTPVIQQWRAGLINAKRTGMRQRGKRVPGPLKNSTARTYYSFLMRVLRLARKEWGVDAAVVDLEPLSDDSQRTRHLTVEQEQHLLDECAVHIRDIVTFLLDSGARRSEAETLPWSKLSWSGTGDAERATVHLPAPVTKANRPRRIRLPRRSSQMLRRIWNERRPNDLDSLVFLRPQWYHAPDSPLMPMQSWHKAFRDAVTRCKFGGDNGDFHIHDCRHQFAWRLSRAGARLEDIRQALGHASLSMADRYSAWIVNKHLDAVIDLLDEDDRHAMSQGQPPALPDSAPPAAL